MASSIQDRIDGLKLKLRAREGQKLFKENTAAIQAEIDRLESALARLSTPENGE